MKAALLSSMYLATVRPTCAFQRVPNLESATLTIGGQVIRGVLPSYGHAKIGDLVAVTDSEGFIEVAVVNGSAAKTHGIKLDDKVRIRFNA